MLVGSLHLKLCMQNQQLMTVNGRSMLHARIFFTMNVSNNPSKPIKLFTDISQPYNTDFKSTEVEVGPPVNHRSPQYLSFSGPYNDTVYKGAFNHGVFSEYIEDAYRSVMPFDGTGITMTNNIFNMGHRFLMPLNDPYTSGW